jgi:hypothetical protein
MAHSSSSKPDASLHLFDQGTLSVSSICRRLVKPFQRTKDSIFQDLDESKNQIRLLLLYPSEGGEGPIQCDLKEVSLDSDPQYEALSYAWGDPKTVKTISLRKEEFTVTLSAWTALKALRYKNQVRVLWIDAICIHQNNDIERNAQIRLMGMIYRKASTVRVWIGTGESNDKMAISLLRSLATGDKAIHKELLGAWAVHYDERILALHFFEAPWWTRLWVVQEVALGRLVIFQKGHEELDFQDLLAAYRNSASFISEHYCGFVNGMFDGGQEDFLNIFASIETLSEVRNLVDGTSVATSDDLSARQAAMTWSTIANLLRVRKASYDKDRLYALYGLLPSSIISRPGMSHSPSASVEEAYISVTFSILEVAQCLMMFNFLGSQTPETSPELPSWVPDWRLAPPKMRDGNLRLERERLYNASNGTEFYLRRLSSNTICLKGFRVGLIIAHYRTPVVPTAPIILKTIHREWWQAFGDHLPSIRSPRSAFMRTTAWDCAPADGAGSLKRLDPDEWAAIVAAQSRAAMVNEGCDNVHEYDGESPEDARRTNYMMNCARGRAMVMTEQYSLGMAPDNVQLGDHIFIVSGSSHPVILRPSKRFANTWRAVGECYLDGYMDGGAVRSIDEFAYIEELHEALLKTLPDMPSERGSKINHCWDEILEQVNGLWKWILIE